jgi:uncharacterized protein YacL
VRHFSIITPAAVAAASQAVKALKGRRGGHFLKKIQKAETCPFTFFRIFLFFFQNQSKPKKGK